jgi:TetR/AcrR family transcriptional regulator, mexJK operon transcriptional repressor
MPQLPSSEHGGRLDKRAAIIDAAEGAFLRNGYTETSVDAIAVEAGVSKQTIYNHFGDKEQLFRAVIRTAQNDAEAEAEVDASPGLGLAGLEDFLGDSDDLDRDLRLFAQRSTRFALREDIVALRRLVIAESARHPELLDEWAWRRPRLELSLARAIETQARRGVLDVPDAQVAAHQFVLLVLTEAVTRSGHGLRALSNTEVDEIVESGVELWLRAYRASSRADHGADFRSRARTTSL